MKKESIQNTKSAKTNYIKKRTIRKSLAFVRHSCTDRIAHHVSGRPITISIDAFLNSFENFDIINK